ncbi:uncharacterized protein LOC113492400 [Trichoplusia ni]|uniref:Uncharacterized protein LOC113492400 n=1 Tax=Trichoplusia ni TaxID=7111 RepID=A0A7E5VBL4_TRINI|nr:uncharacterized protein LOC113492400 [Trichoplusia ni]
MSCKIILKSLNVLLLIHFILPDQNVTKLFNEFKLKYKRFYYGAKHEKNAFNNFVNNFNNLNDFIAKQPNQSVVYKLNKYADQDPEEVDEYYGIKIKPYSEVPKNATARTDSDDLPFLEDMHLYNLNEVNNLYQKWMKSMGKPNYTKKLEREVHYYRFVKTVVEINRQKAEGKKVELDGTADIVQHPDDYFYG